MYKDLQKIIETKFPEFKIVSAYEYKDIVVYNLVPNNYIEFGTNFPLLDSAYSINKKTKQIDVFLPLNMPKEEYLNGKKIL